MKPQRITTQDIESLWDLEELVLARFERQDRAIVRRFWAPDLRDCQGNHGTHPGGAGRLDTRARLRATLQRRNAYVP
jgi:hypothetical protein